MDRGTKLLISVRANIRRRYERIPKRESRVMLILGIVLFFTSLMLLPSTVMAYNLGDDFLPFLVPM
ncbi:MAG: hypothetical protein IJL79_03630, partial [Candidatus Methanomethylophilaceae archaeon]|nr:hypothetical protein [Candidatus Methanomethylophilaceae archaeon]